MTKEKEHIVNVVPNAAGRGVRDDLLLEANGRGLKMRSFVGKIYEYAVGHKEIYTGKLKEPRMKEGNHIGAVTSQHVVDGLKIWADENETSRGLLCNYILEMTIEKKLFDQIFTNK
ncbi:MAG: hypothetical protein VB013_04765 [Anaerolineaceae bacterium]|nr:hypothetical protein [Anaerolineaceae bacterium]